LKTILVEVNDWWEWPPATITREIAVKNRSHNPKTTDTKLQSFFIDLTGRCSGLRRCLYETSSNWHSFLVIKKAAVLAIGLADT